MDKRLLELLVCPVCKGPLLTAGSGNTLELICRADRLAYAVRDIPLYRRAVLPWGSAVIAALATVWLVERALLTP